MKESSFAKYLQSEIQSVPEEDKIKFSECLSCGCGEEGLTKSFERHILNRLGERGLRVVPWPEKRQRQPGFFGGQCHPDDLQVEHDGRKVLLECKVLKDSGTSDVRNAFGQLTEYLLPMDWDEGCVVIFDIRKGAHDKIFSGAKAADRNCWFVNHFSMDGCPLDDESKRKDILISAIRVHASEESLEIEICPSSQPKDEGQTVMSTPGIPESEPSND